MQPPFRVRPADHRVNPCRAEHGGRGGGAVHQSARQAPAGERARPADGVLGDYAALIASLPTTDAIAPLVRMGFPNEEMFNLIDVAIQAIDGTPPGDAQVACKALREQVAARTLQD